MTGKDTIADLGVSDEFHTADAFLAIMAGTTLYY